jgi:hypothetical protein
MLPTRPNRPSPIAADRWSSDAYICSNRFTIAFTRS